MTKENIKQLREKIITGLNIAFNKLLIAKQKEDGELIFSQDGQIVKIKAKEFTK